MNLRLTLVLAAVIAVGCNRNTQPEIQLPIGYEFWGHVDMSHPFYELTVDKEGDTWADGTSKSMDQIVQAISANHNHFILYVDRRCPMDRFEAILAALRKLPIDAVCLAYKEDPDFKNPLQIGIGEPDTDTESLTVVFGSGTVSAGGKAQESIDALEELLINVVANDPNQPVVIQSAKDSTVQDLVDILVRCKKVGVINTFMIGTK